MKNLYSCGQDDFHSNVYWNGDSSDFDSDSNGIWFAVQKGKDSA